MTDWPMGQGQRSHTAFSVLKIILGHIFPHPFFPHLTAGHRGSTGLGDARALAGKTMEP